MLYCRDLNINKHISSLRMAEMKKSVRRVRKAVSAPEPMGPVGGMTDTDPTCGHSGCSGAVCNVRYVGPTSHVRDHHIAHTAQGMTHVWTAAVVAGLAVVLTGSIAYSAVNAASTAKVDATNANMARMIERMNQRMERMEDVLKKVQAQCGPKTALEEMKGKKPAATSTTETQ
jgi:hypothetical protein